MCLLFARLTCLYMCNTHVNLHFYVQVCVCIAFTTPRFIHIQSARLQMHGTQCKCKSRLPPRLDRTSWLCPSTFHALPKLPDPSCTQPWKPRRRNQAWGQCRLQRMYGIGWGRDGAPAGQNIPNVWGLVWWWGGGFEACGWNLLASHIFHEMEQKPFHQPSAFPCPSRRGLSKPVAFP